MHAVAPRAADETACCRSIRVEPKRSFGFDAIGHFQPSKQPENRSANDRFQGTADVARSPPSRDEISKGVVQRPVMPAGIEGLSNVCSSWALPTRCRRSLEREADLRLPCEACGHIALAASRQTMPLIKFSRINRSARLCRGPATSSKN